MIECTQTFFRGGNSGIQRVTRNVANQAMTMDHPKRTVMPIIWVGYGFVEVRDRLDGRAYWPIRYLIWIRRRFKGRSSSFSTWLRPFIQLMVRLIRTLKKLAAWFVPHLIILFAWPGRLAVRCMFGPYIEFRRGDTVLLIDSTWGLTGMLDALHEAQRKDGIKVAPMLHDLFPLTLPETCQEITTKYYSQWFHEVVPRADFFITNSRSTGMSLERYLEQHSEIRSLPVLHESFRLGAELDLLDVGVNNSEEYSPIWGAPGRAILAVGTIEPRKNYGFLLDAYEILRSRGVNVSLILIGRVGWKSEAIMHRIMGHADLHSRLLHFGDANDRLLAEAIERADCVVCASIAEGFGLPVVEGLMRGKEVFASDIEVFREIAEDRCRFFDLADPNDLALKIQSWFEELDRTKQVITPEAFRWPNWKESSEELIEKTLLLLRRQRESS